MDGTGNNAPGPEHIEQFFEYSHLPPQLQAISAPFGDLAKNIIAAIPRNPTTVKAWL